MDQFDTNDWKIPSGASSGPASYAQFQTILNNATTCAYIILEIISCLPSPSFFFSSELNTGFIVLEHDLYQQTVDLAVGYTLPYAQSRNPPFRVRSSSHLLPSHCQ